MSIRTKEQRERPTEPSRPMFLVISEGLVNYLHVAEHLNAGDAAVVTLNGQANVLLLDDLNYSAYRRGDSYRYFGGLAKHSPYRLIAPKTGHWHVVVDLDGYAGSVRAGISFLRG